MSPGPANKPPTQAKRPRVAKQQTINRRAHKYNLRNRRTEPANGHIPHTAVGDPMDLSPAGANIEADVVEPRSLNQIILGTRPRAPIETLPLELLLRILLTSENNNLVLASKPLKQLLLGSSESWMLNLFARLKDPELASQSHRPAHAALARFLSPPLCTPKTLFQAVSYWTWARLQSQAKSALQENKWDTPVAFDILNQALSIPQNRLGFSGQRGRLPGHLYFVARFQDAWLSCQTLQAGNEVFVTFNQPTGPRWVSWTTLFPTPMPSTIIPDSLLRGPWTQAQGDMLTFLSCLLATAPERPGIVRLTTEQQQIASQGISRAIADECIPAILLLTDGYTGFGKQPRIAKRKGWLKVREEDESDPWLEPYDEYDVKPLQVFFNQSHVAALSLKQEEHPEETIWKLLVDKALKSVQEAQLSNGLQS